MIATGFCKKKQIDGCIWYFPCFQLDSKDMDKGLNDETVKVPITCLRLPGYFTSKDFWGWVFSTILSTSEIISY